MNRNIALMVGKRALTGALSLLAVSILVFLITELLPGDAAQAILGQQATDETLAALRAQLGLDQPALVRFWNWLTGMLTGDLGVSYTSRFPVADLVSERVVNSLLLAGIVGAISVPAALAIGISSAMYRGSGLDRLLSTLTVSAVAVPEFVVATVAVVIFAVKLQWVPAISLSVDASTWRGLVNTFALPALSLSCVVVALMSRMTRAAIIAQLDSPYVEMAVLKGASRTRVVFRHAIPNAMGAIANAVALSTTYLLGGVVIIEAIFNYPGLASLLVDAVSNRDIPIVQFSVVFFSACYLLILLIADIIAIFFNPRLRKA